MVNNFPNLCYLFIAQSAYANLQNDTDKYFAQFS